MNRNLTLAGRLREVFLEGHWIANTNYQEQLHGLTWELAQQSVGDLNTIAALVYHVNYYLEGLLQVFKIGKLEISDKYSFDMPRIHSDVDWNILVSTFLNNARMFARQVEQMEDHVLDLPFVEEKYGSWLRNIEAVIEHSYYHLGQITMLKKLITQDRFKN